MKRGNVPDPPRYGLRLFWVALAIYSVCPPFTSLDSYWTVPTALSLIRHRTTIVDEFVPFAAPHATYALDCVPPRGPAIAYDLSHGCPGGHAYNLYPVAVSVAVVPMVLLLKLAVWLIPSGIVPSFSQPVIAAFFAGDFHAGHALVELWCASLIGALAVWLQYRTAALFLTARQAVWLTLLFTFGTMQWSIASRNLFQHGLSELLLSLTLYLALLAQKRDASIIRWTALPLAFAFTVRPSNAAAVLLFTILVAIHYRRWLVQYLLLSLPVAIPFFIYNLTTRHALFPRYFSLIPDRYPPLPGFAMHLVSPSRGLFIFTPVLLFSLAGIVLAWRHRWQFPLTPYLIAAIILHTLIISPYWEGQCYGPRYFADITHLFTFFLIPVILHWSQAPARFRPAAYVFVLFAAWGVFTHGRGATSPSAHEWSAVPVTPNDKARAWDWRDPQFLRGLF